MALQEAGLDDRQTGREVLTRQARLFGFSSSAASERAQELLELVELVDAGDQLPASLLLSASFGGAALYLVEEIEGGYFDKLRATPISRMALVLGRLYAEFVKTGAVATAMVVLGLLFGIRIESGVLGFVVLTLMVSPWSSADSCS